MFSIKEVAEMLGFTKQTIEKHIKLGNIKAVRIFNEWRIEQSEVDRLKKGSK